MPKAAWGWEDYKAAMMGLLEKQEEDYQRVLRVVEGADEIAKEIIDRPWLKRHPELGFGDTCVGFVSGCLVARSMRLAVSSVLAALSGYADCACVLVRSIVENFIRLRLVMKEPFAASLGFLLYEAQESLENIDAELGLLQKEGLPHEKVTAERAELKERIAIIVEMAEALEFQQQRLIARYGRINVKDSIADESWGELMYDKLYRDLCRYVHGRQFLESEFTVTIDEEQQFTTAPRVLRPGIIYTTFHLLAGCMVAAAGAVRDEELAMRAMKMKGLDDLDQGLHVDSDS